jgi:RNA 2',3'-cyclic 3'-phosphodiesterase
VTPADAAHRPQPDRHRVFIAVPLVPALRDAAGEVRRTLAAYADRFRWVPPHHLHLTLQFLGDITTAQLTEAIDAARTAARPAAPFPITLGGLGAYPSLAAPRVVWVGVTEGRNPLTALAESLAGALGNRRFTVDPRPFSPHLTLARVRGTGRPPDLRREREVFEHVIVGRQPVAEVIVVKSVLGPSEPTHTIMATVPLEGWTRTLEVS